MVTDELDLLRLRPIVQVTAIEKGLHVRGWSSSFTLGGGAAVQRIWDRLAPALAAGARRSALCPEGAPPAVRTVVATLLDELTAHDMLVAVPADWETEAGRPDAATVSWLESVATRPDVAWSRLRAATVHVVGEGPVAWAASRALRRTGLSVVAEPGPHADVVTLLAGDTHVTATADDRVGAVLPAGLTEIDAIAARLGVTTRRLAPSPLQPLVGAVLAHRLICAVAGLPDPGHERGGRPGPDTPPPVGQRVFVARVDPLRGEYRVWLPAGSDPQDSPWLEDALWHVDALTDPELGPLAAHEVATLPQAPAALGAVRSGSTVRRAVAATADVARLTATGRQTPTEARGRRLRAAWAGRSGAPLAEEAWASHPAARRWWKALTLHFGVDATVRVERLADGVHRARVLAGQTELAAAVEAEPGDAVAFAALTAVGRLQWAEHEGSTELPEVSAPCGATPARTREAAQPIGWADDAWSWPAGLLAVEARFAERLIGP